MKNKFSILFSLITITAILLTGCSGAAAATVPASSGLSTATRLAMGTLKLEGTSQAVSDNQAAKLLTLWEGYQSLSKSDTSSQVELDALVTQIKGVMTADQVQAIQAMDLTDQSINEVVQSMGNSANLSAPASTPNASAVNQAAPGGDPGGMPGGGGDSVMSAISSGTIPQSTPAATQPATNTQTSQASPMLIQALIQMLETKSQASG